MPGKYTYLVYDLLSNAALAELPLTGVHFNRILNGAGSFSGTLHLGDSRVTGLEPLLSTTPARTALYVDRDGELIWGGIIWTRGPYSPQTQDLPIGALEFWSYFQQRGKGGRFIVDDTTYTQQDQLFIARDLINYAQAKTGGNIGITVGSQTSGVLRDRTYLATDFKSVGGAVEELSALLNGFDFSIEVAYDSNGVPTKIFVPSYPRRGVAINQNSPIFEHPGNVIDYVWPEDGTEMATTAYSIGSGSGPTLLKGSATSVALTGYPLLEYLESYKTVSVQAELDSHAQADVAAHAIPIVLPEVRIRADADPVLGAYSTGDDVTVLIMDPRFPGKTTSVDGTDQSLNTTMRITGYEVTPPSTDGQYEQVRITLGATSQNRVLLPASLVNEIAAIVTSVAAVQTAPAIGNAIGSVAHYSGAGVPGNVVNGRTPLKGDIWTRNDGAVGTTLYRVTAVVSGVPTWAPIL